MIRISLARIPGMYSIIVRHGFETNISLRFCNELVYSAVNMQSWKQLYVIITAILFINY